MPNRCYSHLERTRLPRLDRRLHWLRERQRFPLECLPRIIRVGGQRCRSGSVRSWGVDADAVRSLSWFPPTLTAHHNQTYNQRCQHSRDNTSDDPRHVQGWPCRLLQIPLPLLLCWSCKVLQWSGGWLTGVFSAYPGFTVPSSLPSCPPPKKKKKENKQQTNKQNKQIKQTSPSVILISLITKGKIIIYFIIPSG